MNLPEPRLLFGFVLLIIVAVLCVVIALGTVKAETSAELDKLVIILAGIAGGWSNWAFGNKKE